LLDVTGMSSAARTALGAARSRAQENGRPDRLFEDAFAAVFVAAAGPVLPVGAGNGVGAALSAHTAIRTRFYDDYLTTAGIAQVVLVAAGLDARAYRLPWPSGTRIFELDQPEIFEFKERTLAGLHTEPACERVTVPVDLREDWAPALVEAGFDSGRRTAWLVEGLLIYLSAPEAAGLLTAIGALSAPGSTIAFESGDAAGSPLLAMAREMPTMKQYAAMWKGGLGQEASDWLERAGWSVEHHDFAAVAGALGRSNPDWDYGQFLTATKR
jgi:methyltransferase (TIGR00027 family)